MTWQSYMIIECVNLVSNNFLTPNRLLASNTPFYNHLEKADFLYSEFEAPNGISFIIFWDCSVKVSSKIRKKVRILVITLLMLQNRYKAPSTGPFPIATDRAGLFFSNAS